WRLHLYNLLERHNSSAAAVLHVVVTALIVFSTLVTILETTVPGTFRSLPGEIWFGLETSLVAFFTVEYVARCAATSYSCRFIWLGRLYGTSFLLFLLPPPRSRSHQVFCLLFFFHLSRDFERLNPDFIINTRVF
ncbi:hypothetical protein F5888DRAFT_1618485, partial [Russula emetica]